MPAVADTVPSAKDPARAGADRIREVHLTPVAFRDLPLLNTVGVHEPFALRSVIELVTDSAVHGLDESYGDLPHLQRLEKVAALLIGLDVFDLHGMGRRVHDALRSDTSKGGTAWGARHGGHGMGGTAWGAWY